MTEHKGEGGAGNKGVGRMEFENSKKKKIKNRVLVTDCPSQLSC